MEDEYGRTKDKAEVIRELDKLRLAVLLNDIRENPAKYPKTNMTWMDWLGEDSKTANGVLEILN